MEYKVKLELDLTEKDIFEEEVIKAIQEYAKTSAQKLTMDAVDDKMIAIIENAVDKSVRKYIQGFDVAIMIKQLIADEVKSAMTYYMKNGFAGGALEQVVKTEIKQIVLSILGNHDE